MYTRTTLGEINTAIAVKIRNPEKSMWLSD